VKQECVIEEQHAFIEYIFIIASFQFKYFIFVIAPRSNECTR